MKKILFSFLVAVVFSVVSSAYALIASDNAGNYPSGWSNSSNAGTGFGAWNLYGSAGTDGFNGSGIGTAGAQFSNFGPLYSANGAFFIYAGDGGSGANQNAERPFSSLMNLGDVFTHSIAFSFDNGYKGFDLFSSTTDLSDSTKVFNFNIGQSYIWTGGRSSPMTAWEPNRTNGVVINFSFTRTANGFSYSFASAQDSNLSQTGSITASGLGAIKYYVGEAGGGDGGNLYFNNLSVVPEPSTYALLGLSALALGGYVARRRARK